MKKRAFVSFIHEEERIASYLKKWIEKIFLGQIDVFVSSSDLTPGDWLGQIRERLENASFVFSLLSPISQNRPWINFESGCAYISKETVLIPVCHRGLLFKDLDAPFNQIQSFNLIEQGSVGRLVAYLASQLDLHVPEVDYDQFCAYIISLDKNLCNFINSFDELKEKVKECQELYSVEIENFEIWEELELRGVVHKKKVVELSGDTDEAMGFNVFNVNVPEDYKYLVVKLENTSSSTSFDLDKMMKLVINNQVVSSQIKGHAHYNDNQFTYKGDGIFLYKLPAVAVYDNKIEKLTVAFWKIRLRRLLVQFYFS